MSCVSFQDAAQCKSLCCDSTGTCARTQAQCLIYSEDHCINLKCSYCCLITEEGHICGEKSDCNQFIEVFCLWIFVVLFILAVVFIIVHLRNKRMEARYLRIKLAIANFKNKHPIQQDILEKMNI